MIEEEISLEMKGVFRKKEFVFKYKDGLLHYNKKGMMIEDDFVKKMEKVLGLKAEDKQYIEGYKIKLEGNSHIMIKNGKFLFEFNPNAGTGWGADVDDKWMRKFVDIIKADRKTKRKSLIDEIEKGGYYD